LQGKTGKNKMLDVQDQVKEMGREAGRKSPALEEKIGRAD
jgi:hypothetical protein